MRKFLQFENWKTKEVANRVEVTGRSEREIDRIERGMLINCDVEAGWFVNDVEEPASAIEARSDETGTGSAEGESAIPQGDAQ